KTVFGITLVTQRMMVGGLTIYGGCQDHFVQPFEPPAVLDKITREPVEQFGMRGTLAHCAKIRRCAHEATSEMVQPNAIDEHTRDQRIRATRKPACESEPAPAR